MEHYELLSSAVVSGIIPIKKYKSKETGFTVVLANVDGPLVNGYLTLATEAHDDDGLPHTLEHLVFMGSEEYPFKGMLDLFANRCLAQGTNAWTATDHTCYTMTTAGSEGFLNLLPIYLDHVLYPTLTNSAYVTEVHHVNGEGEDAGIVYCEMQARENSGYSRTFLEFLRSMYPGICGYKSETGGIMKNLRETCNHEKVCSYHAAFYRPENLCLVITGNVLPEDVFRAIRPFEEKIKAKGQLPPYNRPWMSQVPPLEKEVVEKHIIFATEDESAGMVLMGWRGPSILDHYLYTAFDMLFNYLTDTPIAPLQQDLVEIDEPFCGDVSFHLFEKSESSVLLHADNVPKEKLFDIKERVLSVLKNISSNNFDLDRMKTLLHRSILEQMNALEDTPHDTLASLSIVDFLYATNHNELQENVDKIKHLEKLQSENSSFWIGLLNQFVIGQKMIVIIGDPSDDFMKKSGEEEKNRVKNQAASLGVDGLKKKKEDLDTAIAENSVEPSKELVSSLKIPSTDSIKLHTITSHSNVSKNDENPDFKKFQLDGFPCEFHMYHVKSLFTQLYVVIDTASLSPELQMYLPLYSEVLLESPILKDGKVIPYEEVVKQLAADTLYTSTSIGVDGGRFYPGAFASILVIVFKVENEKYEKGVTWLKDILFNLQFSKDRLKLISNKMMSDVASQKRNGRRVAAVVLRDINYNKSSNFYASNMTRQHAFLTRLVENLDKNEAKVLSDMESLRTALLCSKNCRFYVASDLANLPEDAHNVWRNTMFQNMNVTSDRIEPVPRDGFYGTNATKAKIVGIGSVESAFLMQTCKSIDNYEHPDYPAMLVFIQYLCALEGPLWRQIRGCGLSYNYRISVSPNTGTINFILAKSTHVFNAYKKAQEIVDGFISGKTPFEHGQIEAAISGAVFQEIESVQTISDAISQNIISEYKRVPSTFQQVLLKNLSKVSVDDLKRVGSTYFTRLFDPAMTSVALCCHPTKVEEIVHSFASVGVNFETISTLEDEFSK